MHHVSSRNAGRTCAVVSLSVGMMPIRSARMPFTSSGRFVRSIKKRPSAAARFLLPPGAQRIEPMTRDKTITGSVGESNFEFDIGGNVIRFQGRSIPLQPLETRVLRILLNNRGQVTSVTSLSRSRRGAHEAVSAESVREAISSLRQKLEGTGLQINSCQSVGYENSCLQRARAQSPADRQDSPGDEPSLGIGQPGPHRAASRRLAARKRARTAMAQAH